MPIDFDQYRGLTEGKVIANQNKYGYNTLSIKKKKGFFTYAVRVLQEPMLLMLLLAAILYFTIGSNWDGLLMIVGVLTMIGIDIYQEKKTDRALEALKELSTPKVNVIRDGEIITISSEELAKGDLLVAQEGDRIAGDGKILDDVNFSVDESLLTGETGAIHKSHILSSNKHSSNNIVYTGTLVLSGQAVIEVTAIGNRTQYGQIGSSLSEIKDESTPLQKKIRKIVKIFGIVGALACLALMIIVYVITGDVIDSILKGLTLAISVIPEEIPVILTVFAALGAYRLTKKHTLVRHINAVETVGHITTLCTDKTGTLTENRMALEAIYADGKILTIKETKKANHTLHPFVANALLASQPHPYDPMDISIHQLAKRVGLNITEVYEQKNFIEDYGFDQKLKFMGHLWKSGNEQILAIKGSAENVIERCDLSVKQKNTLLTEVDKMASQGLRVLAVANKYLPAKSKPKLLKNVNELEFVALLGFRDPPREDAKRAIKMCQKAGISVRMITGDHPQTALQIAKAVGINHGGGIMSGKDLETMTETELDERISDVHIFARITPEQKLKIVNSLKRRGEVVAMMGDGVNDAPSLKEADIGIAMGKRGTNVAREAADIILLDDRLLTVVGAVSDGRRIFDNIQKAIGYIFTVHSYIILTALLIPLSGLPILLTPIHIILLELVIDPTCALVFESIPAETNIMKRKPRGHYEPVIPRGQLSRVFAVGIMIFLVTVGAYVIALQMGLDTNAARTIGFSAIIWSNLFIVLTSVSYDENLKSIWKFVNNRTFVWIYSLIMALLIFLVYTPGINLRFGFEAVPIWMFLFTIVLGFIPLSFGEILKKLTQRI